MSAIAQLRMGNGYILGVVARLRARRAAALDLFFP